MKKTAVIGICGQSVFLYCDKLPKASESIKANDIHIEPGGKGANASTAIKRLGGSVSFLVSIGNDDYSKVCKDFFKKENLNVTCIEKEGKTDYGLIMHDSNGDNCVTVYIDNNVKINKDDIVTFKEEIKSSDYVLLSGELSDDVLLKVMKTCGDNNKIIFDPSPVRSYPLDFLDKVWLFTPNEVEYDNLFNLINPKRVVITLGKDGARLIENGKITDFKAKEVDVINTTGAGDVFNGALCYALELDYSLTDAIKFALKAATYKVTHNYVLEGIPTLKDISD